MPQFDPRDYLKIKPEEAVQIALKNGFTTRIIQINGVTEVIMYDYDPIRINLQIRNGIVIGAYMD